jgi:hypothetical protein
MDMPGTHNPGFGERHPRMQYDSPQGCVYGLHRGRRRFTVALRQDGRDGGEKENQRHEHGHSRAPRRDSSRSKVM